MTKKKYIKMSESAKLRIGKTPEERSARMSLIAKSKWSKMTAEEKIILIDKMVKSKRFNENR